MISSMHKNQIIQREKRLLREKVQHYYTLNYPINLQDTTQGTKQQIKPGYQGPLITASTM